MLPGDIALADRNLMNFVRRWMNFPDISNQQNRRGFLVRKCRHEQLAGRVGNAARA
jgi:hypothetical protein